VNPGGEIHAGGDIFIMGSLCGKALAGQPQNEDAIILALDFRPTQIQIGPFVAAGIPSSAENNVEYAHIENGNILVDDYLTIDPFGRLPWPEVR
jgi:septum site-determining protein MinC